MKRLLVLLSIAVGTVAAAGAVAFAVWHVSASAPTASAKGASMATGNTPVAAVNGSDVTVSWTAASAPVSGYTVKAYDASTNATRVVGATCAGTTAATSCTESSVPNGSWRYTVTPVQGSWTGTESPKSATATVNLAPPTAVVTFPTATYYSTSTWNAGCSSKICGTAASSSSTVASVKVSVKQNGTNLFWNGSSFASASEVFTTATGTTSWSLPFAGAALADGAYTVHAVATDASSQTGQASVVASMDNTAPTGTISVPSFVTNGDVLAMAGITETGSGVASAQYLYCSGGSCTPSTSIGTSSTGPDYPVTWNGQPANGTYRVGVKLTDVVGNVSSVVGIQSVTLDHNAPTGTMNTLPAFVRNGQTLSMSTTADTGGSGVASIDYLYCSGVSCTPSTVIGTSTTASAYSLTWNGQPADGTYRVQARISDTAGNTTIVPTTPMTVTVDNTAPTGTMTAMTYAKNGDTLTMASTSDGSGSGVASVQYLYCSGVSCTPSTSIGSSSSGGTYGVAWSSQPADGSYRVGVKITDGAGNVSSVTGIQTITVDNTAPTGTMSALPTYTGNGDTLSMSATADGGSGVASVQYLYCNTGGSCTPATSIGTSTASGTGFAFVWNGQPADGAYRLAAKVTDNAGNTSALTAVVTTTVDNNAPTGVLATLVTPFRNSETLSMSSGTVTDNGGGSGVASVQYLYCEGSGCTPNLSAGTASAGPTYSATWNTSALAGGTYRVSATLTDLAGNTSALAPIQTLTLDRIGPSIVNVAIPNGNVSQRLDSGDQVVVTYSELLDTHSLCSAWSGTGSQSLASNNDVTVTVTHGTGSNHDVLTVTSGTCAFNFGSIDLGTNTWVNATTTFKGTGSGKSKIDWSASAMTLTITLGNGNAGNPGISSKTMTYTTDPDVTDALGNPIAMSSYSFFDGF